MGVEEITAEIEQNKEHVRTLQQELEGMVPSIIDVAGQHVMMWSKAKARSTSEESVAQNPTRQEELGRKMVSLKVDVDILLERLPTKVKAVLDRDDLWVHEKISKQGLIKSMTMVTTATGMMPKQSFMVL